MVDRALDELLSVSPKSPPEPELSKLSLSDTKSKVLLGVGGEPSRVKNRDCIVMSKLMTMAGMTHRMRLLIRVTLLQKQKLYMVHVMSLSWMDSTQRLKQQI